jgi:hypothetical protein
LCGQILTREQTIKAGEDNTKALGALDYFEFVPVPVIIYYCKHERHTSGLLLKQGLVL